jgi:membrane protein
MKLKLRNTKFYRLSRLFLETHHLRDNSVSFYQFFIILKNKLLKFDVDVRAAAVAFNFTLAIFPTIIFLFSVIPYIPVENLDLQILNLLSEVMPSGIFEEVKLTIIEIVSKPRGGILSFGFLFALYASTSGMMALMTAFNMTNETAEKRGFLKSRLIALMLNFMLTFVLMISIIVLIVGRFAVDLLFQEGILNRDFNFYIFQIISYLVVFSVFFVTISVIYYVAPAIPKRWKFFNSGSITASILTILITNLFSFYLSNFASYNRLYGAIGTLIALMIWFYLIALILILGFDINASIEESKDIEKKKLQSQQK